MEAQLRVALTPAAGLEEDQPPKAGAEMSRRQFLGAAAVTPEAAVHAVLGSAVPLTVEMVEAIAKVTLAQTQLDQAYAAIASSVSTVEYLSRPDRYEADPSGQLWDDARIQIQRSPLFLEDQWRLGEIANALRTTRPHRALLAKHPETETLVHQLEDREAAIRRAIARWVSLRTQDLQAKEQDHDVVPEEAAHWLTRWRAELADLTALSEGALEHSDQHSRISLQMRLHLVMADQEITREAVEAAWAAQPPTAWDTPEQQVVSLKAVVESLIRPQVERHRAAQEAKFGARGRLLEQDLAALQRFTEPLIQEIQHPESFYLRTEQGLVLRATPRGAPPGSLVENLLAQETERRWDTLRDSIVQELKGAGADDEMAQDIRAWLGRDREAWLTDPHATPETLRLAGLREYLLQLADPEGLSEFAEPRLKTMLQQLSADELTEAAFDATRRAALVQRLRDVVGAVNWRWAKWGLRLAHRVLGIQIPEAWVVKLAKWRGIPLAKGIGSEPSEGSVTAAPQVEELLEGLKVVEWPEATTARALILAQQWPSVAKHILFVPWNVPALSERRTPIAVYAPESWWEALRGLQTGAQPVTFFSPEALVPGARGLILLEEQADASRLPADRPAAMRIHQEDLATLSYELVQQLALQPGLRGRILLWTPESAQPLTWDQQQYLLLGAEA